LSKREREIVLLVCEGLTTAEIADKLSLSQLTVSTHRKNLLRKLDLKNAAQLAMLATRIKEMDR
jgi:Response regulator containing a CheY-like receiver domain and an HTH DNA-binding domain